ncbi:MAG: hypothetical protein SPL39_02160 [Selenomonadaceae bacterium]|nr:hypothetical protein [Selenomonadaceae bacterium]
MAATMFFAALLVLGQPTVQASPQYLDNNPMYPVAYYHADDREYVDLESCNTYESGGFQYYGAGYVSYHGTGEKVSRTYKVRRFRQSTDGGSSPEYYDEGAKTWVALPSFDKEEIASYLKKFGYQSYIKAYHPYEYYMFKVVYKQVHKEVYPDRL